MGKIQWTIGEVAEILGENVSLVRFWSNNFSKFLKPNRNAKGNRLYRAEDVETLRQIHHLVKVQGLTLDGAAKQLSADKARVEARIKVLDSLRELKAQLQRVKREL